MLRWDEQLPPRVDNQVLRWNPEVQNILHLGNDAKNGLRFFVQKGWLFHHHIDSEWIGSCCLSCEFTECLHDKWVDEEMWTSDISTLANRVTKLLGQTGSSPVCFPFFCSCQNNHIISHDESIYQQIKKTTRLTRHVFIFDAMWHVASPAPPLAISMALSICRATKGCPGVSEGKPNLWWVWWRRWWVPWTIGIYWYFYVYIYIYT